MGSDEGVLEEAVEGEETVTCIEGIHHTQSEKEDAQGVHSCALVRTLVERMA